MSDLRNLRVQTFSGGDLATVASQAEDFFKSGGEETDQGRMLGWRYQVDSGTHHLVILYTE